MVEPPVIRSDGLPMQFGEGVVPILRELEPRRLAVIGTGIERYPDDPLINVYPTLSTTLLAGVE